MVILHPTVEKRRGDIKSHGYETTKLKLDLDKMPIGENIEWNKQTSKMI